MLGAREELVRGNCIQIDEKERRTVKRCRCHCKNEANEQCGRKMSQSVIGNRKVLEANG